MYIYVFPNSEHLTLTGVNIHSHAISISCLFLNIFFLYILPHALADILGRLAQRLLVSDRKKNTAKNKKHDS